MTKLISRRGGCFRLLAWSAAVVGSTAWRPHIRRFTSNDSSSHGDNNDGHRDDESLTSFAARLAKSQNVVVLMGAGASVSAGIPDFRTPGTGLYDRLQKYSLPYPEAIFDLDYYRTNPRPFADLCREIWPGQVGGPRPTLTHAFCKVLEEKGCLRRIYTQNIDNLEEMAGVSTEKLVESHGHFRSASCIECKAPMDAKECRESMVDNGEVPKCHSCGTPSVKPSIVFFGEELPWRFQALVQGDTRRADALVVIGTSLQVMPVAAVPQWVSPDCPRLLINRERVGDFAMSHRGERRAGVQPSRQDVFLEGDCDNGVRRLCQLMGWESDLDRIFEDCQH